MAIDLPTVDVLRRAKIVTTDQIKCAVELYMENPEIGAHPIAEGYVINLKAAVKSCEWAWKVARDPAASVSLKRGSIWTAILLARAQQA
ncbi:hypothetical protein MEX01_45680 [Methylorubrum extorquens]|uniref:hypothetical protein n=1 Tax=Methylorubrum extorquens TaxID=408 RepID=UPI0011672466|nr:hypothetical protein [Methylorubrum extorquens]GEL43977.1 hypothetical protein MEX01_45680 [Methylorubrum extorquens]